MASSSQSFPHIEKIPASRVGITGPRLYSEKPQGLSLALPGLHRELGKDDLPTCCCSSETEDSVSVSKRLLTSLVSRTFQTDAESITREHTQRTSVSGLGRLPQDVGIRNQNISAVPEGFSHV